MTKILIADDSPSIRMMLGSVLNENGYQVEDAENGRVALEKAADFGPDLIITDLNMPEMNGITLVQNLRQNSRFKFTPILVLTTEGQEEKRQSGRAAGATGWLVKPFNPEKLIAVVKKLTNR
ncbi:MAG: response regulator [Candidatus Riflebacteria bacterium]